MPSSIARETALDHDRMQRLVPRACTTGPSQQRWRDELVCLVRAHLVAEETTLGWADRSLTDAVDSLDRANVPSSDLVDAGARLRALLAAHAVVLAGHVLEPLEQAVPRKEIRRLGGAYADRRDQVLHEEGGAEPPRRLNLPRAELYELARRAGVAGRSAMSRRDLIDELQRRQATR